MHQDPIERAHKRAGGGQTVRLALAGDTMLGRGVAGAIASGPGTLLDPDVVAIAAEADPFLLNLECCISERGEPWPAAGKPFFFRAPPRAAELLVGWGVDCVSLANNHALDFGHAALLDTLDHLRTAGIAHVGAGADVHEARAPCWLTTRRHRVAVLAATDHPADFAAGGDRPGVAYAPLEVDVPGWLTESLQATAAADVRLCMVHWGPNMTAAPVSHVRRAARELRNAGTTLVVGSSAHVPHGAAGGVLYDVGDLLDDYAVDAELRNDLGLLFVVTLGEGSATHGEAIPLALDFCHTRLANGRGARLVCDRFARACAELGGDAEVIGARVRFRLA